MLKDQSSNQNRQREIKIYCLPSEICFLAKRLTIRDQQCEHNLNVQNMKHYTRKTDFEINDLKISCRENAKKNNLAQSVMTKLF